MVKDLFRGFGYTLGKVLAFIFIGLVIATILYKIDFNDFDITKIPFKQMLMRL